MTTTNIQPGELMIGNYLLWTAIEQVVTVREILMNWIKHGEGGQSIYSRLDYSQLSPIPLNEQWLLEFGFEIEHKSSSQSSYKVFTLENFTFNTSHNAWWYFNRLLNKQPDFVHQLQNLYWCLTATPLSREKGKGEKI